MDIQNAITVFHEWLTTLRGGEATLYGIILTGFAALLGWLVKKYRQRNSIKDSPEQIRANNGSIAAGEINNSSIRIINQNINVKKVKASHGGTATGVIIGENSKQKQDERDGK